MSCIKRTASRIVAVKPINSPAKSANFLEKYQENIIQESLVSDFGMSDDEASGVIHEMSGMEINEACRYQKPHPREPFPDTHFLVHLLM